MESDKKIIPVELASRRKFVARIGIASAFAAIAGFGGWSLFSSKKTKNIGKSKTVKMLTQDGRLVEIDESLINVKRKKASNSDLQNWIKK